MNSIPLIQTKIIIPAIKNTDLRRAKLTKKLKAINKYPLTIVHAGAGYGKSTALALYVTDEKMKSCWYSISAMDDDILPFLSYLLASIRTNIPEFGIELEKYISEMDRYIREQELNLLGSMFINEVLSIKQDMIVILDDFQQIGHSNTVNRWMEILLDHIPVNLHLVIISRSRPPWKPLMRMKANGAVLEVTKDDLVLSQEEVELLLNENYGMTLPQTELSRIYQLTEGWVIALGMIAGQSEHYQSLSGEIGQHSRSLKDLFQYLALEVFEAQEETIQEFLVQTSILEDMTEEICNAVLQINHSKKILSELHHQNLFIQKISEEKYRYHTLFKEFLEERLLANPGYCFHSLNKRAARFFEEYDLFEEALLHYEKINNTPEIARVLREKGMLLLESGKLESLLERLVRIPNPEKDLSWILWFLQGEIHRYRSNYKEAEHCYQRAILIAENQNDIIGKSKALEGKARIYLDTIQPYHAERILYEAIQLHEMNDQGSELEMAKLYHLLAENLINLGHGAKAEKWLHRAKTLNVPIDDGNLEARLYLRTGRFEAARKILLSTEREENNEKSFLPQSHRETELLLSLIAALTGNGEKAKKLAQAGIRHGLSKKAPFVEACGWIRMGHAVQLIHKYDLALAINCYETALEIMDQLHVEKGKAEALMGLCYLYGSKGDYDRAHQTGKLALQETDRVKDVWLSSLITICMGIASFYSGRSSEALQFFEKADILFQQCGDDYGGMLSHFWLAYLHFHLGQQQLFLVHFSHFLKTVEREGYQFFLLNRTIFGPRDMQVFAPLLIEAQKNQLAPHIIVRLFQDMNLIQTESHPGYTLRVQALGNFRVWIGEKEVEERGWQRGKAKELLQLLITNKRQLLPKEEIFQQLWPGQQEKNAARDFKVALNALNHVLEPNRKARANSFFIIREGSSYGMNPNAGLEIDTVFFEQFLIMGLEEKDIDKAMEYLKKGLNYYTGDFLPDRRYDDWCIQERERLLRFFLRGAEKLAQLSVRKENYDAAIDWCLKIVSKDRTWEEAYRLLMYCYYRKNNRPQAIKWYQKCCETLEDELGVAPLEPTVNMYEMIMSANLD